MKRILIFTYGAVAYSAFLISFTYLIFFLAGIIVPKTVNSGQESSLAPSILINLSFVALFGIQHTIMARPGFKRWWTQIVPRAIERSTFVLLASLILAAMYWQWRPLPAVIWSFDSTLAQVFFYSIFALGWAVVFYSSFLINHFDLFGLRQVFLALKGKEYTPVKLRVASLYRYVRHPLMLGLLLAFWFTPHMTLGHLVFAIGFTVYIIIGVHIEERTLIAELGSEYQRYRETTPMLLPTQGKSEYRAPLSQAAPASH